MVILVDRLDRVSDAVAVARRARNIALQSIGAGMTLSVIAMIAAAIGWLTPVAGALSSSMRCAPLHVNGDSVMTPCSRQRFERCGRIIKTSIG